MPVRRLIATIAAAAALSVVLLVIPAYGGRSDPTQLQTWPSRTPTSGPNPPSDGGQPPGDGGDSGESAPPTPLPPVPATGGTATAVIATSIATLPAAISTQLPGGALLSTAEPCGNPPTALAVEAITLRQGPDDDSEATGRMSLLTVRPVIGRAARAPWWLVALEDGQAGWVPDRAVIIHGYTGAVQVFGVSAAAGQSQESLPAWNPTPNPICAPSFPVAAGQTAGASAQSQDALTAGEDSNALTLEGSGAPSSGASAAGASSGEATGGVVSPDETTNGLEAMSDSGAPPSKVALGGSGNLTWVLLVGIALILGGAIAMLLQAISSRSGSSS